MQTIKLDPVAYALILAVLGIQIFTTFFNSGGAEALLASNDEAYQNAVFGDADNKGVMHQVFRQNEVDRELLKSLVLRCGR